MSAVIMEFSLNRTKADIVFKSNMVYIKLYQHAAATVDCVS